MMMIWVKRELQTLIVLWSLLDTVRTNSLERAQADYKLTSWK